MYIPRRIFMIWGIKFPISKKAKAVHAAFAFLYPFYDHCRQLHFFLMTLTHALE